MQRNMLDTQSLPNTIETTFRFIALCGMALILACNCWSQLINEASCTAGLGLPKGRVNEDPGAVPMKQTPGSPLKLRAAVKPAEIAQRKKTALKTRKRMKLK